MAELKNARWEKFALGIANGLTQRKAYYAAFPNSVNWKPDTADKRASELYNNREVQGRLEELAAMTTSKAVMTATQRKEWLTGVILDEMEKTQDKLKAVDILNKMDGAYIEQVQVNGSVNNPMAGLTTDELKKLIYDG